ncbi:AcrR family transcriptional regulator [Nocardioides thalensis]|uniref:AcrR family transcriptional regulator n=1 Tax=Nocardioides thalensis TaxID=1914755 RepID=A0A853C6M9_9ACTN|nr:TetR/AcrR family transcriptional regulator [Nocardioides thalensis]NYJ02927.1 AcrR family transcriptional regulator [Nocardioides thalensis]
MTAKQPRHRPPLTRDAVFRSAVALADDIGVAALSMRKLAERLGVEAMSLYHHVPNKEAILDGMVDLVFTEVHVPADAEWRDAMRQRARSLREALLRHRWAIGLLDSRTNPGLETLRHHDAVIGCLRRGGFTIGGAAHAFSVLDGYIYGFVVQESSMPFDSAGASPEAMEELTAGMRELATELPHLAQMVEHARGSGYAYADEFEVGLDVVLDGLERRRPTW